MNRALRLTPHTATQIDFSCPLCDSTRTTYIFHARDFRVLRCAGCTLTFSDRLLQKLPYSASSDQPIAAENALALGVTERTEEDHTSLIAALEEFGTTSPVLVLSDADDEIVRLLGRRGIAFTRVFDAKGIGKISAGRKFTAGIVSDAIMRASNPRATLDQLRQHLPVGAPLILSLPLLDGRQARLMGRNWHEWQAPNLWFFTRETLSLMLVAAGFEHIWFRTVRRHYSLDHLIERLRLAHEGSLWFRALRALHRIFPERLRNSKLPLPSGTAVVTASSAPASTETVVSIVVPVFNEHTTFQALFDALLAKQLPGIRKEIIVVESNSTDGSRDLVRAYENHPDVRVIYQPGPHGKGNAVREGLKAATGDILMIQDADLEYDLDDYDGLLAPLLTRQSMFVLGSRHQGEWKIRKLADAPMTAAMFNLGHSIFRTMINIAVNAKMTDPFTMFKVFRREALFGIDFVCNRFDFDIELVIKLIRKGCTPLELPVNYASRSFAEGKKVSVTRDGMTWILTILRARFSPLGNGRV
jgi:Glycosyl transferase family 2